MTDEEILKVLGIENSDDNLKSAVLNNFRVTVDARLMNILNETLSKEDIVALEKLEPDGISKDEMLNWLSGRVTNIYEISRALSESYAQELKERLS